MSSGGAGADDRSRDTPEPRVKGGYLWAMLWASSSMAVLGWLVWGVVASPTIVLGEEIDFSFYLVWVLAATIVFGLLVHFLTVADDPKDVGTRAGFGFLGFILKSNSTLTRLTCVW